MAEIKQLNTITAELDEEKIIEGLGLAIFQGLI
jgi:hypothetical protein